MSSEFVVQFASASRNAAPAGVDRLDSAGQTILQLLNKAANVAEQNSKHAIDMAQQLSHQLRAAQQRISELEAEVGRIRTKLSALNNGCTRSIQKLKIAFCSKGEAAREMLRSEGSACE